MGLPNKYKTINNEATFFFETPSGAFQSTDNMQHFKSRWEKKKPGGYGRDPKLELNTTVNQERFYS